MLNLEHDSQQDLWRYKDPQSNYIFEFNPDLHRSTRLIFRPIHRGERMYTTGRDTDEYYFDMKDFDPNHQYVEVGSGLGELTPEFVRRGAKHKPIAIDPVDYAAVQRILEQLTDQPQFAPYDQERIPILIERCKIMRSDAVHHIQTDLETALAQHPELKGIADAVIDERGARYYSTKNHLCSKRSTSYAQSLAQQLLKDPNGPIIGLVSEPHAKA